MDYDVSAFLSFELKKELAERYFGFRKLIEDDCEALAVLVRHQSLTVEQRIFLELARIALLLGDPELIREFFVLAGLDMDVFFDPYLLESPASRDQILAGLTARGLTRRGRFRRLIFDRYENLARMAEQYRKTVAKLQAEEELIREEIEAFYRQNDITGLLDFFRRLEPETQIDSGVWENGVWHQPALVLEEKLRVAPPVRVASVLSILPPLPCLAEIKKILKRLADAAYLKGGQGLALD